nr:hypothetical protein [Tanacetum cinerariifolium]
DIVLQKSINDDVQNKDLNCIDEDFQELREKFSEDVQNEEQMFVKGKHEEKEEEILNQDSIEVNVLKVNEADNDKGKSAIGGFEDCLMKGLFRHRLDEPPSFSLGPEVDDFSIEQINQTNFKDESRVPFSETESHCSQKEKQSFDRIQTVFFQAESEIDVLKEDIKPDIKDASIRVQPKRDSSIAWYLKSPFKERECKLYDVFDKFAYQKGETLRDFYLRFSLLLNDMNMYNMKLEQFQVNTKFLNTLLSKWSKFITDVKLVRDLHTTNVDQLHAYLGQH